MAGESSEAAVKFAAGVKQHLRLLSDDILLPAEGDGLEHRPESHRRGKSDALGEGVVHDAGIGLHRGCHQRFARDERDHEFGGGLEPGPVCLAAQGVDVGPHRPHMLLDEGFAARPLLAGRGDGNLARLEVGGERHLRIHGDVLASGQVDDHIGPPGPGIRGDTRLHVEIDPLDQAGGLHHIAQLGFAPYPSGCVVAEGRGEGLSGAAQALLGLGGVAQLLGQLAMLQGALGLQLGHLRLHAAEGLLHRRERLKHLALALLAVGLGGLFPALPVHQFAILLLLGGDLPLECDRRGLNGGELRAEQGLSPRLLGAHRAESEFVLRGDQGRIDCG